MRLPSSARLWLLLAATVTWLWASSVFTPWAVDRAPRLWLYDLLFYLRFALVFWGIAEVLRLLFRRERIRPSQALPLALIVAVVIVAGIYAHTEAGLRWKVRASREALAAIARDGYSDQRRRAGHFLIDTTRMPCGDAQPWLWLGRPHGGGSGIGMALVHSGDRVPDTPSPDAFAFAPLAAGWWLANQRTDLHPRKQPHGETAATCRQE